MSIFFKRLGGFYKYRFLMQQLVMKDIKLKYRRSILGYLWSILNPLMIMVIMVIVFSNMFRSDIEKFPVYLIIGQTLFNFMSESTNQAIMSITGNAALLKKTYVPKYVLLYPSNQFFVNTLFALGVTCSRIYCMPGDTECVLSVNSIDFISGICFLPGTWNALGSGFGIFQRYPVYLQCSDYCLDVFDSNVLPDYSSSGQSA